MRFMLVRGDGAADEKLLHFKPSLSGFDGSSMEVLFDFDNPLEVSTGDEPDKVVAFFTDPRLLMDPVTGMFVQNDGMVTEMPRQLMQTAATAMLQQSCYMVSTATGTLIACSIIIALSLTALRKSIWQFINMIQIIAYIRFFVEWSANAAFAFECMDASVTGSIQTDFLWSAYDLVVEGLGIKLDDEKYESKWIKYLVGDPNLLRSLGVYPIIIILVLLAMAYCSILALGRNSNLSIRKQYIKVKRQLYWNSVLRLYLEIDLKLTHQALAVAWFLGASNVLRFSLNAALSLVLIAGPFLVLRFLIKEKDNL